MTVRTIIPGARAVARGALLGLMLLTTPAGAVEPNEVLQDPALEARARDLSKGLRCLVCQNESIDESHASLARDLRLLVRDRLTQGDTDEEVVAFIVDRYGEFVLLKPTTGGANWVLWGTGPVLFLFALGMGIAYVRRRSVAGTAGVSDTNLDAAEQARLDAILKD